MNSLRIRLAETDTDLERLSPVLMELRGQFSATGLRDQIKLQQTRGYEIAMAELGGKVVGVAGFVIGHKLAWGKHMYIDDLVVSQQHQSAGIGSELIEWLRRRAQELGCGQLHLDSGVQRFAAHRFYLRHGFDIASHHFSVREVRDWPLRSGANTRMYTPPQFEQTSTTAMRSLIAAHPLAALVALSSDGISAEHIPMLFVQSGSQAALHGHVARANPVWQKVGEGSDVLAIFQGPNTYISPNSYPSKHEHGKVVPTWNYLVVHARGNIHWQHDVAWLRDHVEATSAAHESRDNPWRVSDAPSEFIDRMLSAIVGFEIQVSTLKGKWKLSQNRTAADRQGVIDALKSQDSSVAAEMAIWMEGEGGGV